MLKLVCSNYDDFDQSLISSSDSELGICTAEEETYDCFCYEKQENGFIYICPNQPKPGKLKILKHVFSCFSVEKLLKVIKTCKKVKNCSIFVILNFLFCFGI